MNDTPKHISSAYSFAFFGSSRLSVIVLDELSKLGLAPEYIVTTPDKPRGRKLAVSPNEVKTWAIERNIPVIDSLNGVADQKPVDAFVVASYGKIIRNGIINLPKHKTLNIHPSLLPKYRGASPLPSTILDDAKDTGVSIMRIDEEMDHGPIVAQKPVHMHEWPAYEDFEEMMAREGARLLAEVLPGWVAGTVAEKEQNHGETTYTRKFTKEDAEIRLDADPYETFRKIQAFQGWLGAYFFMDRAGAKIRVKVTKADYKNGHLTIEKVIPEGGKEMSYKDFFSGYVKNGTR